MASHGELLKTALRARADFEYFCNLVDGLTVMKHEREWFDSLQDLADGRLQNNDATTNRLLIIAPPGSGKSQVIGILYLAWMIGRNPTKHYGLLSYSDPPAWERATAIRNLITDEKAYKLVFPSDQNWADELGVMPVVPDMSSWSARSFKLLRVRLADSHPTLRAGGVRSSVISYRLDGLVIDDAIDPKGVTTTDVKEKGFKNYEHAVLTRMVEDHWQAVIGTRFADDDFIGRLKKRKGDNWKQIHVKALTTRSQSYWPEKYSTGYLLNIKQESPEMFQLQYMGDTSGGASNVIHKLVTYEGVPEFRNDKQLNVKQGRVNYMLLRSLWIEGQPRDLVVGVGADTAMKDKQQNDWGVMYVGGLDKYGILWVLDRRKGHWSLPALCDEFKNVNETWHPFRFWVEDSAQGTPAAQTLIAEIPSFPIQLEPATQGGKRSRAYAMSLYIADGRVRFPAGADWFPDTEYYLTHYPNTDHDDDIDALYQLIYNLQREHHPAHYDPQNRPTRRIVMK